MSVGYEIPQSHGYEVPEPRGHYSITVIHGVIPASDSRVSTLCAVVKLKNTLVLAYMTYGNTLKSPFRDVIYKHFQDHLKDEMDAIYNLSMKIVCLGGTPPGHAEEVPPVCCLNDMLKSIADLEDKTKEALESALKANECDTALRVDLENMLMVDGHHADDMHRMMCDEGA